MKAKSGKSNEFQDIKVPIGEIAKNLEISERTIRIYEKEKPVTPKRSQTNRRLFGHKEYKQILSVIFLTQKAGVNISGVKIIFALLKKFKVNEDDYIKILEETAKNTGINQAENYDRYLRRGRPKDKTV